jgi:hypothetical protein
MIFGTNKGISSINFVAMKRFVPPPTEMIPEICSFLAISFNLAFALEMDWLTAISLESVVLIVERSNGIGW